MLGKYLDAALEAAESIDVNARCILLGRLLTLAGTDWPEGRRAALAEAIAAYE